MSGPKDRARAAVDGATGDLVSLSHAIWARPELAYEEHEAASSVADALEASGFTVTRGAWGLPTAVDAVAGDGPLVLVVCAEYDALPGMGHACGHNIIAAAAVGAGRALAEVAGDIGVTVRVLGTPAEEGGGGKIRMLEAGAFDGAHAAMLVHPGPADALHVDCLATALLRVEMVDGHADGDGHAGGDGGGRGADAIVVAQTAIGLLRQALRPTDRVHGVAQGSSGEWYVRATTLAELVPLEKRVRDCFAAGARAACVEAEVELSAPRYSEFREDAGMLAAYQRNAQALGRRFFPLPPTPFSTDLANVSLRLPAIHPLIGIGSWPAVNHQPAFADACATPAADRAVHDGALAMAWALIDLATDPSERTRLLEGRAGGEGTVGSMGTAA